MWTCPECGRIFEKANQPHSCHTIPSEDHFKNKNKAKELFDCLIEKIQTNIGSVQIISIPCCIHLFGTYDFLAALPKKNVLEIRFAFHREFKNARITQCAPMSARVFRICLNVAEFEDLDAELIQWLDESYHLKDRSLPIS